MDEEVRRIMVAFSQRYGTPTDWVVVGRPRRRLQARIYRIRSAAFPSDAALKLFLDTETGRDSARDLAATLRSYHPLATAGQAVPCPYGQIDEPAAVIMEWVSLPTLQLAIHGLPGRKIGRIPALHAAASWLRWLHASRDRRLLPWSSDVLAQRLERLLQRVPAGRRCPSFDACLALVPDCLRRVHGEPVWHGSVHGDFTPYNILIGAGRAVGLDFVEGTQGALLTDLHRLLVYLYAHRYAVVHAGMLGPTGCAEEDWRLLVDAYGEDLLPAGRELLVHLQFLEIMRRWSALLAEPYPPSALARHIERNRLREMAVQLARRLR